MARFITDKELTSLARTPEGRRTVDRMQKKLLRGSQSGKPGAHQKFFRRQAAKISLCGRLMYEVLKFEHGKQKVFEQPGEE